MTTTPAQAAAIEAARQANGQFGTQNRSDSGVVDAGAGKPLKTFYLSGCPKFRFDAVEAGERWNGWATPVITKDTLAKVIEWTEEPHHWDGDALVLEPEQSDAERYEPREDGLYDTGWLGWTFLQTGDWPEDDEEQCELAIGDLPQFTFEDPAVDSDTIFIRKKEAAATFEAFGQDPGRVDALHWFVFEDPDAEPGEGFVVRDDVTAAIA